MTRQRYLMLAFVAAALLSGWVVQAACVSAFAQFEVADTRIAGVFATSTLVGLVAGAATLFALLRNRDAVRFTDEVVGELARVTWPTREETLRATTTVVVTTLLVAALLGVYDLVWKNLADLILFNEG